MKKSFLIGAMCCALMLAAIFLAGCTENSSSSTTEQTTLMTTAAPTVTMVPTIYVNSTSNGATVTIPTNGQVIVRLNENPTTGFSWNATVSKGLSVISDTFYPPETTLVGAGGYHEWTLGMESPGTYTFNATYVRPWEGQSPTSDTFNLTIKATPE